MIQPGFRRLLVPLDGSAEAEAVLPVIEQVAGPLHAEVVLIRVVEPLSAAEIMATAGSVTPDPLASRELEARRYLGEVESRLSGRGLRVRAILRLGNAASEIVGSVGVYGADLIAMTTHGRSGLSRVLFGSVAEAVLRAAPVPVLVVRAPIGEPSSPPSAEGTAR